MSSFLVAEDLLLETSLVEMQESYPEDYEDLDANALLRDLAYDPMLVVTANTDILKRRIRSLGFSSVTAHRFREKVLSSCKALRDLFVAQNEWVGVGVVRVEIDDAGKEVVLSNHDSVLPLSLVWAMYPRINLITALEKDKSYNGSTPSSHPIVHVEVIYSLTRTKAQSILLFLCDALRPEDEDLSFMTNQITDIQRDIIGRPMSRILVLKIVE
jgi:hypothetical protein